MSEETETKTIWEDLKEEIILKKWQIVTIFGIGFILGVIF